MQVDRFQFVRRSIYSDFPKAFQTGLPIDFDTEWLVQRVLSSTDLALLSPHPEPSISK